MASSWAAVLFWRNIAGFLHLLAIDTQNMIKKIKTLLGSLLFIVLGSIFGSVAFMACFESQLDYLPTYSTLVEQGRVGEALNLGEWIKAHPEMPNSGEIAASSRELEEEYNSFLNRSMRLGNGFVKGEYNSKEDAVGALISDFLFVGDVRDLGQQSLNKYHDKEVDKLIVALSSIGLATSVAIFFPEPSSTTAGVVAETGISLLKGLKKTGALTGKFSKLVVSSAKEPQKLASIVKEVTTVSKLSPPGTVPYNIRNVENLDEMKSLNQGLKTDSATTTVLLSSAPKIDYATLKQPQEKLMQMAKHGMYKTKKYSRTLKFIYSGGLFGFLSNFMYLRVIVLSLSLFAVIFGLYRLKTLKASTAV